MRLPRSLWVVIVAILALGHLPVAAEPGESPGITALDLHRSLPKDPLLVLAVTVCIRPLEVPKYGMLDLGFAAGLSVALLVVSLTNYRRILRAEAALLLAGYVAYVAWRATPS